MVFHKHIPAPPLSSYVDCIVYVEGNNKGIGFPKPMMSLVFNLHDSFKLYSDHLFTNFTEYKKHWIAGLQTKPSYVESSGESKMLVVQFTLTGAIALIQQPLHYFADDYVPLDRVFNRSADEVWEQLQEASSIEKKISIIEIFLLHRLLGKTVPKKERLSFLYDAFKQPQAVKDICRQQRISRKHLNFLCKEYLGVSPKMLSSLNRLNTVLQTISHVKPEKLTAFAYDFEFVDQAHFNNYFKRFTGLKPGEYIRCVETMPSLKLIPHFLPVD